MGFGGSLQSAACPGTGLLVRLDSHAPPDDRSSGREWLQLITESTDNTCVKPIGTGAQITWARCLLGVLSPISLSLRGDTRQ
eukprot:6186180-Pleurochrysis_carterae.AAC.1